MTKDDIIRMAREAGFKQLGPDIEDWVCFTDEIERFAELLEAKVRADDRKLLEQALKALEVLTDNYDDNAVGIEIDAIVALRKRLAQPAQEPVLQDIEQYRMQMASISTAAIGYWKEGDGIHPDYDTPALRDVAMLYAKYDALYKAQPAQEPVAGVVIREGLPTLLQDKHIKSTDQRLYTDPQQREWVGLTNEEVGALTVFDGLHHVEIPILANFVWAVEAKLKEKNT